MPPTQPPNCPSRDLIQAKDHPRVHQKALKKYYDYQYRRAALDVEIHWRLIKWRRWWWNRWIPRWWRYSPSICQLVGDYWGLALQNLAKFAAFPIWSVPQALLSIEPNDWRAENFQQTRWLAKIDYLFGQTDYAGRYWAESDGNRRVIASFQLPIHPQYRWGMYAAMGGDKLWSWHVGECAQCDNAEHGAIQFEELSGAQN